MSSTILPPHGSDNISCFVSPSTDPWYNLALEEWLFRNMDPESYLLYLWRNSECIVIGRNQNPWKEVNMAQITMDRVPLIRRRSGGGTVYHDIGNSIYTVMMPREKFARKTSVEMLQQALIQLDIPAEITPRFDVAVDGKKVSGSAYKIIGKTAYHHGTMLIDTDLDRLRKYLKFAPKNITSKGVESVPSPVTRLREHSFTITHQDFCKSVHEQFCKLHHRHPSAIPMQQLPLDLMETNAEVRQYYDELQTWFWTHGQTPEFHHELKETFSMPDQSPLTVGLNIHTKEGYIKDVVLQECESGHMDRDRVEAILEVLVSGLMQNGSVAYDYEPIAQVFDKTLTIATEHDLLRQGEDLVETLMTIRDWLIASL